MPTVSKDDVNFVQAVTIRKKNALAVLQGKVCRVQKMQTSTTGKHGGAKIHFFGFDVFTNKKVEEIFNSHDMVTVPDAEKFVVTVRKIKDNGVLDAKCDGVAVTSLKIPAAGQLREQITRALKNNADCQVECMATFGQRGCCAVVGVSAAARTDADSASEGEHDEQEAHDDDDEQNVSDGLSQSD